MGTLRSSLSARRRVQRALTSAIGAVGIGSLVLAGCSTGPDQATQPDGTLTIATVDNGDVRRMQELSAHFTDDHPGVELEWLTLSENELRQRVSTDIGTGSGQFDVVMLGTYETPIWAERGWLEPLDDMPGEAESGDLLPSISDSLASEGTPYAQPFYGESSFTMYRSDLFKAAGLTMPEEPSWEFIAEAAKTINDQNPDVAGICLRGKAGWGENIATITAMANSYGARWFDNDWSPQFTSEPWQRAMGDYAALAESAPDSVADNGYAENLEIFRNGDCGIWVDATAAAPFVADPEESQVADQVDFALAPTGGTEKGSNWLWSWAFAIPQSSVMTDEAKQFIGWATSEDYTELVAQEYGWLHVPAGTRGTLYDNPQYQQEARFAALVRKSIETADPLNPTVEEVPYRGIQYVGVPAFQSIGNAVGGQFADAIAGRITVDQALKNSQWVTEKGIERTRLLEQE